MTKAICMTGLSWGGSSGARRRSGESVWGAVRQVPVRRGREPVRRGPVPVQGAGAGWNRRRYSAGATPRAFTKARRIASGVP
ncbi:hypothetical protein GCM10020256_07620 [Streptomyces thermocoprophilus]